MNFTREFLPPPVTPSERNRSPRVVCKTREARCQQLELRLVENLKLLPPPVTPSERNRSAWAVGNF
jgi:hypothetical protein